MIISETQQAALPGLQDPLGPDEHPAQADQPGPGEHPVQMDPLGQDAAPLERPRVRRLLGLWAATARHRGVAVVSLAIVLAAVAGLSAYRVTSTSAIRTYSGHGIAFDYPAAWQLGRLPLGAGPFHNGHQLWTTAVILDQADWIGVTGYRLASPVFLIGSLPPAAEAGFRREIERAGGVLLAGPREITMGGLPGIGFQFRVTRTEIPVQYTVTVAFKGRAAYAVVCEQALQQGAGQVQRACDQVIRTFAVTAPAAAAAQTRYASFDYPPAVHKVGSASQWVRGIRAQSGAAGSLCSPARRRAAGAHVPGARSRVRGVVRAGARARVAPSGPDGP
jgi:hypothetical protein